MPALKELACWREEEDINMQTEEYEFVILTCGVHFHAFGYFYLLAMFYNF